MAGAGGCRLGVADPTESAAGQEGSNSPAITGLSPAMSVRGRRRRFVLGTGRDESVQSRTPVLLRFLVRLPSVEARGRWRERGRMGRGR